MNGDHDPTPVTGREPLDVDQALPLEECWACGQTPGPVLPTSGLCKPCAQALTYYPQEDQ